MQGVGFDWCSEEHLSQRMWSTRGGCGNGWTCLQCSPATHSRSRSRTLDKITGLVLEEFDVINELAQ